MTTALTPYRGVPVDPCEDYVTSLYSRVFDMTCNFPDAGYEVEVGGEWSEITGPGLRVEHNSRSWVLYPVMFHRGDVLTLRRAEVELLWERACAAERWYREKQEEFREVLTLERKLVKNTVEKEAGKLARRASLDYCTADLKLDKDIVWFERRER